MMTLTLDKEYNKHVEKFQNLEANAVSNDSLLSSKDKKSN